MKKKKVIQILLVVCLVLTLVLGGCARSETPASSPTPTPPEEPVPEPILDSDGDGFSDWFEENIAGYDPNISNDRHIIFYCRQLEDPGLTPYVIDKPTKFFIEKGKVPPGNIIGLSQEGANAATLENAINQVAEKSDKNDLVLLKILAHGSSKGFDEKVRYTMLDKWLNKIEAKVVIVVIMSCGCEAALSVLKDGPCPRIVFVHSAGEFIGALGEDPEYFKAADANRDGYVSVGEIGNWIDNDPKWGPDWGELYEKGRSFVEAEGYSKMSDTSNVASKIYLTDYTPY